MTDPSLLFAVGVMRLAPAELASGFRSSPRIEVDLYRKASRNFTKGASCHGPVDDKHPMGPR